MNNKLKYLLSILIVHFIYNLIHLLRAIYLEKLYLNWLKDTDNKKYQKIYEYKFFLKEVIKITGVRNDYTTTFVEPLGFGQIKTSKLNVIENFPNNNSDMVNNILRLISEIKGVLKERLWGTINPIYWLNAIIFLPQKILKYLGLKESSITAKILNLLWWFIAIPIAILQEYFSDKLKTLIEKIFS